MSHQEKTKLANRFLPFLLLLLLPFTGAFQCGKTNPEPLSAVPPPPEESGNFSGLEFVDVTLSPNGEATDLPVIICIHGLGDTPENLGSLFYDAPFHARVVLPRGTASWGPGYSWFDVRVPVQSQDLDRLQEGVRGAAQRICSFIKSGNLKAKPIVTGFSQGGILSYAVAVTCPGEVGLAIPIAGLLPPALVPSSVGTRYPAIRALHGDIDDLVPYSHAVDSVRRLKEAGLDATLQTYPGVLHTITPQMQDYLFNEISNYLK